MELSVDAVDVATELIRVSSLSGEEGAMADAVQRLMAELGYSDVRRDDLGSVIGRVGPDGATSLLFDGHMDVVPPVGHWSVDPFGALVRDGRIFGRGATDMKGGLAAALVGVAAATPELARPVLVSATVLEETVEGVALARVLDSTEPEGVVICEPSGLEIKVGQRGRAELLLTAHGIPAHAASPDRGRNPITLMAAALGRIDAMEMPIDPLLGEAMIVSTDVVSDPYPSISLIPSAVTVRLDRRTLLNEDADEVVAGLLAAVGDGELFSARITADEVAAYTGVRVRAVRFLPAWRLEEGHLVARALTAAVEAAGIPARTGAWGFCTNGSESAIRQIPTIGFGPGGRRMRTSLMSPSRWPRSRLPPRFTSGWQWGTRGDARA
jgi:putative selenium metabolism hydrolase